MADQRIVNPLPKTRYQSNATVIREHREMVDSMVFQRAVDMALLQYQAELCGRNGDMSAAAGSHFKATGALEFLHILKTLSESAPAVPRTVDRDNLKNV